MGGIRKETYSDSDKADTLQDHRLQINGTVSAAGTVGPLAGKASFGADGSRTGKREHAQNRFTEIERQSRVTSRELVPVLNDFFRATTRARLPTLLVLDDFDELTSSVGPSHLGRSQVLSSLLGTFATLEPTCLVIGLRNEYMQPDISRQYQTLHVPPMTRQTIGLAIDAWAEMQAPALHPVHIERLKAIAEHLLAPFETDQPVVMPFPFLQLIAFVANQGLGLQLPAAELLLRYLRHQYDRQTVAMIERLVLHMSEADMHAAAEAAAVEPEPYAMSTLERRVLENTGLLRPFVAGDPEDSRIVIDPLCAYLRAAQP